MNHLIVLRALIPIMNLLMARRANLVKILKQCQSVAPQLVVKGAMIFYLLLGHHSLKMMMNSLNQKLEPLWMRRYFFSSCAFRFLTLALQIVVTMKC